MGGKAAEKVYVNLIETSKKEHFALEHLPEIKQNHNINAKMDYSTTKEILAIKGIIVNDKEFLDITEQYTTEAIKILNYNVLSLFELFGSLCSKGSLNQLDILKVYKKTPVDFY